MTRSQRLRLAFKAIQELGPRQVGLYAWYLAGLRSGYLRRQTPEHGWSQEDSRAPIKIRLDLLNLPTRAELASLLGDTASNLFSEADEIVAGRIRLFGGPAVPLQLAIPGPIAHWTIYEGALKTSGFEDIKFVWEPARFGWAFILARAYYLSGDDRYVETFWRHTEAFLQANPTNLGPNWISGQEVALRILSFSFAAQVFSSSSHSSNDQMNRLAAAIADHATRIRPTLAYARAQNNNHLLMEAIGLYTAGLILPDHPAAKKWSQQGWHWLNKAFQTQISPDGEYVQHSTNYHRLMLQAALWVNALQKPFPDDTYQRLGKATTWLLDLMDLETGRLPNLGPNDGAYIHPLTVCSFDDYRPVIQASALVFLGEPALSSGLWDESALWLGIKYDLQANKKSKSDHTPQSLYPSPVSSLVLRNPESPGWAYLRTAHFTSRPGHADQLHLDLWWRGLNVAQDAGTYLYNADAPWDNALASTGVHNTLTIEDQDQMTHAGRFLWLDWAQARILSCKKSNNGSLIQVVAQHDGYRRLGLIHQRTASIHENGVVLIKDSVQRAKEKKLKVEPKDRGNLDRNGDRQLFTIRLHWLLPDWPWQVESENNHAHYVIRTQSPLGWIMLTVDCKEVGKVERFRSPIQIQVIRAGEILYGTGQSHPTWGWMSPTYAYRIPALSFSFSIRSMPPISFVSEWVFP